MGVKGQPPMPNLNHEPIDTSEARSGASRSREDLLGGPISLIYCVYPSASPPSLSSPSLCSSKKGRVLLCGDGSHSGHGSTRCSPARSRRRSGWGFQIQHLRRQTANQRSGESVDSRSTDHGGLTVCQAVRHVRDPLDQQPEPVRRESQVGNDQKPATTRHRRLETDSPSHLDHLGFKGHHMLQKSLHSLPCVNNGLRGGADGGRVSVHISLPVGSSYFLLVFLGVKGFYGWK